MGIRSQQQVPNFVSQNITEQSMPKFPFLRDPLDVVVKDISIVAGTPLIHRGRTEHIAAITDARSNRMWKDLQHQMSGIDPVTIIG
jgi:hypothetical protein